MKKLMLQSVVVGIGALVVLMLASCSKQKEHHDHDGHDYSSHSHGQKNQTAMTPTQNPSRLYCKEHECFEDVCIICHDELRDRARLWCQEHDRYEDRCWLCHPEIEDKKRPYCAKHYLYQDECFMCRPELKTGASPAPPASRIFCKEHNLYEDECGVCHPELAATVAPGQGVKIRLPNAQSAALAGVRTVSPALGAMAQGVECYAEISFDQNGLAQITAPVGGILQSVEADWGDRVSENRTLAKLWSAEIVVAVSNARLAKQTLDRELKLRSDRISAEKNFQDAETAFLSAHQQLLTLGFDEPSIEDLLRDPQKTAILKLRAPFAGQIIERDAVRGARVESGKMLFTVANTDTMWAMLSIPERHLERVRVGQTVEIQLDAVPDRIFSGTLTWLAAQVDERTRMTRGRVEIANLDSVLRANQFGRARILTANNNRALVVPRVAVQQIAGRPFVFVQTGADLFEARPVRLGSQFKGDVEIIAGLSAEDRVAVTNSFALKSQLLISKLGAGCAD